MNAEQLEAVRKLWDATNEYVKEAYANARSCPECSGVGCATCNDTDGYAELPELIRARDAMGKAFPAGHPIYTEGGAL